MVQTTRFATTCARATSGSNLLTYTSLLRLGPSARLLDRGLSRLTGVRAAIDSVVRSDLYAIALGLRVASFRLRARLLDGLANASRDLILPSTNLPPFLGIGDLNLPMCLLRLGVLQVGPLTLRLLARGQALGDGGSGIIAINELRGRRVANLSTLSKNVLMSSLTNILRTRLGVILRLLLVSTQGPIVSLRLTTTLAMYAFYLATLAVFCGATS